MMKKAQIFTALILFLSVALLSGCEFSGTTKKDMEAAENMPDGDSLAAGTYEEYSQERFEQLHGNEKFILFFHADWCPTCRTLEKEIKENLTKLNSRTILEVNYDTENGLKKEYEITAQSTLVFINSDGSVFEKRLNPDFELIEKFFY